MSRRLLGPDLPHGGISCSVIVTLPLSVGIANLGWQLVVSALVDLGCSVGISFADSPSPTETEFGPTIRHADAAAIFFSVPFETELEAVPKLLHLAGLPIWQSARNCAHPMIVVGGMANTVTLLDFVDAVGFGDARLVIPGLISCCRQILEAGHNRNDRWADVLAHQPYTLTVAAPERLVSAAGFISLASTPIHTVWTSDQTVYGTASFTNILLALGCARKCPFCVMGGCYLPQGGEQQVLSVDTILGIAEEGRRSRGANLVRLLFASSRVIGVDYLKTVIASLLSERFRVSTGSLSVDAIDRELLELMKAAGQQRIVVAPETVEHQRWRIGKDPYSDDKIYRIATSAGELGLRLGLYTMVGIPDETDADLTALGQLLRAVQQILSCHGQTLELHLNQVFPKPHTPFEWHRPLCPDEAVRRLRSVCHHIDGNAGRHFDVSTIAGTLAECQQLWLLRAGRSASASLSQLALAAEKQLDTEVLIRALAVSACSAPAFNVVSELPWGNVVFTDHSTLRSRYLALSASLP